MLKETSEETPPCAFALTLIKYLKSFHFALVEPDAAAPYALVNHYLRTVSVFAGLHLGAAPGAARLGLGSLAGALVGLRYEVGHAGHHFLIDMLVEDLYLLELAAVEEHALTLGAGVYEDIVFVSLREKFGSVARTFHKEIIALKPGTRSLWL